MARPAAPDRREILSQRVNLLRDTIMSRTDPQRPVTYEEISTWLRDERGVSLSRARWSYLINGSGKNVSEEPLLRGIADYFEVTPDYLLSDGEVPAKVEQALRFVRQQRLGTIRAVAARQLGGVDADTLASIMAVIDEAEKRDT